MTPAAFNETGKLFSKKGTAFNETGTVSSKKVKVIPKSKMRPLSGQGRGGQGKQEMKAKRFYEDADGERVGVDGERLDAT